MKTQVWTAPSMPNWSVRLDYRHVPESWRTCGSACLSMVTGKPPGEMEKLLPYNQRHFSTTAIRKVLARFKWKTRLIRTYDICDSLSGSQWKYETVTPSHIVIFNARTNREEASWFLCHRGVVWHNFEQWETTPLFLLRNPMQDAIVCYK